MNKTVQFNQHQELIYFLQGFLFLSINIVILVSTNLIGYILLAIGFTKANKFYPASSITLSMLLIFVSFSTFFLPYATNTIIDSLIGITLLTFRMILTKYIVDGIADIEKEIEIDLNSQTMQFLYKILLITTILSFLATFIKPLTVPFAVASALSSILFFLGFCKTYYRYSVSLKNLCITENKQSDDNLSAKFDKKAVLTIVIIGILLLIGIF